MKWFSIILIVGIQSVYCQDFSTFNKERLQINRIGMTSLTAWSVANIGLGIYGNAKFEGSTKYFYQMNALWSGFNLCLSVPGLIKTYSKKQHGFGGAESLKEQSKTEKIFLFNAALDLAYITGGFLMKERAKWDTPNEDMLKGYGNAVILQGSFLMFFDAVMYFIHNKHGKKLMPQLDLGLSPRAFKISYTI